MSQNLYSLKLDRGDGSGWKEFATMAPRETRYGTINGGINISSRPWEAGDPVTRFRVPLHPFDAGVVHDKLINKRGYATGNCDTSFAGLLLHPPLVTDKTLTNATDVPFTGVKFASKRFYPCGRYMYTLDSSLVVTEDKDFGSGKAVTAMAVFNNELIVGMGASEKIYKRTSAGVWSQATDATYAVALGVVGKFLWRADESGNLLSNCATTPLTLTNWTPTGANRYAAGDSTYAVKSIIDYGGVTAVFKDDGLYMTDNLANYFNQAPQLARYPSTYNGRGAFVAQGAIFCPSTQGLLRIRSGESVIVGPELAGKPNTDFMLVNGGIEYGGAIYLLVNGAGVPTIWKMVKDGQNISGGNEYRYYEWCQFTADDVSLKGMIDLYADDTAGAVLIAAANTGALHTITLTGTGGVGAARYIDSTSYKYGLSMSLETGEIAPTGDMSVIASLVGVTTLCRYDKKGDSLVVSAAFDQDDYTPLLDTQNAGGIAPIEATDGWQSVTRYAPPGTSGQILRVKFEGTATSVNTTPFGTNRPEIREAWAFGYARPRQTEVIKVVIIADPRAFMPSGTPSGMATQQIHNFFRDQMASGQPLKMRLPGYDEGKEVWVFVSATAVVTLDAHPDGGMATQETKHISVDFVRADFSGEFDGPGRELKGAIGSVDRTA